jgi:ubiquinone/menaquinone biosynthesis C-methylase UbiE
MQTSEAKRQAILCWTLAPCGPAVPDHPPGCKEYFDQLVERRREYAPWMAEVLRYQESKGRDVLDVGSGQGIDVYEYASCGARAVGLDLTPRHVELSRLHLVASGLMATLVEGDAEAMPFPDKSFDLVSSNGVLHHTPNIQEAFAECLRVLRPSGTFTVILYNRNSFHYWAIQVLWHGLVKGKVFRTGSIGGVLSSSVEAGSLLGARPLVRVYTPSQVRRMLKSAGFESVQVLRRHLHPADSRLIRRLHIPPGILDKLGRVGGWYVIGRGRKPASP